MELLKQLQHIALANNVEAECVKENHSLAGYTWFKTGGNSKIYIEVSDENFLRKILQSLPKHIAILILGNGSNVLVRDGGWEGITIRLGDGFQQIQIEKDVITVGAAYPLPRLAMFAARNGLQGLTFFAGIPGTVGGSLTMNAGCFGMETKSVLLSARAMDRNGDIHELNGASMSYRKGLENNDIVFLDAKFQSPFTNIEDATAALKHIQQERTSRQPIKEKTGGSTFKNPNDASAWKLIDAAGCRGLTIGGAKMSEKHCNFIINTGSATSNDIETLGNTVQKKVNEHSSYQLEWEIKRLGIHK